MSFILLGILNSQVEAVAANSYDLLTTTLITSNTANVTLSGLGSYTDYKHLQLRITGRTDRASAEDGMFIRFNNNTSGYRSHYLGGDGSTLSSADRGSGLTRLDIQSAFSGSTSASGIFGVAVIDILDFSSSSKNTVIRYFGGVHNGASQRYVNLYGGLWNNTAAVTEILIDKVATNFVSGTRVSLYGVK